MDRIILTEVGRRAGFLNEKAAKFLQQLIQ